MWIYQVLLNWQADFLHKLLYKHLDISQASPIISMTPWTSLNSVYAMSNRYEKIILQKVTEPNGFKYLNIGQNYPLIQHYYQEFVLSTLMLASPWQ